MKKFVAILLTAVMLLGCVLVSGVIGGLRFHPLGIGIGLLSGLAYAAYNITTKLQMRWNIHPLTATFYCFLFAAVIALFTCDPASLTGAPLQGGALPLILLMGICTSVLPYIFITLALLYAEAGKVSILASGGEPTAAVVFGVLFYREIPTPLMGAGLLLTVLALMLLCKKE